MEIRGIYSPVERPRWEKPTPLEKGGLNGSRERKGRVGSRLGGGWEGTQGSAAGPAGLHPQDTVLGVPIPAGMVGTVPRAHNAFRSLRCLCFLYKAEEEMRCFF